MNCSSVTVCNRSRSITLMRNENPGQSSSLATTCYTLRFRPKNRGVGKEAVAPLDTVAP